MVKVQFLTINSFDNTKIRVPGFLIFGRHLVRDVVPCQALPLRCFVFESIQSKKGKEKLIDSTKRHLGQFCMKNLRWSPTKLSNYEGLKTAPYKTPQSK